MDEDGKDQKRNV